MLMEMECRISGRKSRLSSFLPRPGGFADFAEAADNRSRAAFDGVEQGEGGSVAVDDVAGIGTPDSVLALGHDPDRPRCQVEHGDRKPALADGEGDFFPVR